MQPGRCILTQIAKGIPPAIVLSTGRCGSTMLSNILNRHPRILSLSEFFTFVGGTMFRHRRLTGDGMWKVLSRHTERTQFLVGGDSEELLYPFGAEGMRYTRENVPPVLCCTLPHLTERHEGLFDELEPVVRGLPRQSPADHCRSLFAWLCERFGRGGWVERSGGSSLYGARLVRNFPEARFIHIYRDGRETAISMLHHHVFREMMVRILALRRRGYDPLTAISRQSAFRDTASIYLLPLMWLLLHPKPIPYDRLKPSDFGELWNDMVKKSCELFDRLPGERVLHVKFEDVQRDPEDQIRRLVRFIDPSLEDEVWVREVSKIPRPTLSKIDRLDAEELAALTHACRQGMNLLGYSG